MLKIVLFSVLVSGSAFATSGLEYCSKTTLYSSSTVKQECLQVIKNNDYQSEALDYCLSATQYGSSSDKINCLEAVTNLEFDVEGLNTCAKTMLYASSSKKIGCLDAISSNQIGAGSGLQDIARRLEKVLESIGNKVDNNLPVKYRRMFSKDLRNLDYIIEDLNDLQ